MGDRMFTKELIGLEVETITGRLVGVLEDIVINTDDGSVKYLLVSTSGAIMGEAHKVDENGRAVIETSRIRVENGKIVIN
jgi:sporulation protein YlmC with PRC-barrel domain